MVNLCSKIKKEARDKMSKLDELVQQYERSKIRLEGMSGS